MACTSSSSSSLLYFNSILLATIALLVALPRASSVPQSYVVYMGSHAVGALDPESILAAHHDMLAKVLGSDEAARQSLLYSYKHHINGFAATLDSHHVSAISAMPEVVSVFPNEAHSLHTTRSWEFLGLENSSGKVSDYSIWTTADYGDNVIIGLMDTGIWPESESFSDAGLGPIPARWKGTCVDGTNFTSSNCNRKLIGARYFVKGFEAVRGPVDFNATGDFLSARDKDGHGTHTSSTAAGTFVGGANIFGFGNGTAKGGAPRARVAMYKVCWPDCYDADILAAFDAGIEDGVDVFSISLGGLGRDYFSNAIAIGSFHAVAKDKVVVCSAGNSGPDPATVTNVAPWILTVAASSMDRKFQATAILGDKTKYYGASLSEYLLPEKMYPLVTGVDVKSVDANETAGEQCLLGALDPEKTKDKIVACLRGGNSRVDKGAAVKAAGGVGMILCNQFSDGNEILSDPHVLPATHLNAEDSASVLNYISKAGSSAVAYIEFPTTILQATPAPQMAAFSSRGPNTITTDILKPDITAPGVNVLAAWTQASPPSTSVADQRIVKFNVISGTSMSCPHIAGVVALLRALYPTWSASAIKSAIMTSASHYDNSKTAISNASADIATPFNYGSGHINPNAAANPGLVYDASSEDYVLFLCSQNYNQSTLQNVTGNIGSSCPRNPPSAADLNYPSISLANLSGTRTVVRTVTYVGGNNTYEVEVRPPSGIEVKIVPSKLVFSELGEKKTFYVKFQVKRGCGGGYVFGHFTWTDGNHRVRSPIVVNAT